MFSCYFGGAESNISVLLSHVKLDLSNAIFKFGQVFVKELKTILYYKNIYIDLSSLY